MATKAQAKPAAKEATSKDEEATGPFVLVQTTNGKTRRRAGRRFDPAGTKLDVSKLSEADKLAIQNDPVLKAKEVEE